MAEIVLDIAVDVAEQARQLGALAGAALRRALVLGLAEAGQYAAGEVVLRADAAGIESRTGTLLNSVAAFAPRGGPADGLTILVGVPEESPAARYAYLLTEQDKPIVPHGHKFLAIPIGENLTGAGVARIPSPREVPDLQFRGRTAGVVSGEDYTPLFALVEEVTIFGRGVLEEGTEASQAEMVEIVEERINEVIRDQQSQG